MSLSKEERTTLVGLQLEKADKNLKQADEVYKLGYYDMAANRYYYACFHALQALLINDGISCHTHKGLIAEFGKNYIRNNKIDIRFGKFISKLEQLREKGDYNCMYEVEKEEIESITGMTKNLIDKIKDLL